MLVYESVLSNPLCLHSQHPGAVLTKYPTKKRANRKLFLLLYPNHGMSKHIVYYVCTVYCVHVSLYVSTCVCMCIYMYVHVTCTCTLWQLTMGSYHTVVLVFMTIPRNRSIVLPLAINGHPLRCLLRLVELGSRRQSKQLSTGTSGYSKLIIHNTLFSENNFIWL